MPDEKRTYRSKNRALEGSKGEREGKGKEAYTSVQKEKEEPEGNLEKMASWNR